MPYNSAIDSRYCELYPISLFMIPLHSISKDAESKHLNFYFGFFPCIPVDQNTRQGRDFCDPATVLFAIKFNFKIHEYPPA